MTTTFVQNPALFSIDEIISNITSLMWVSEQAVLPARQNWFSERRKGYITYGEKPFIS
jgi:hypothetical protein